MSTLAWQRVRLIAVYTLREALRQRAFGLLLVVALVFAVGARGLRDLNLGASELKFTADLGLGALSLFGSLLAIVGTVQTVFAEVEHRTLQLIFARPVSRREFVVGKLAGMQLMLGLFSLLMLLALGLMLRTREIELLPALPGGMADGGLVSAGGLVLAVAAQWLKCGVLVAVMLLLCSIAQSRLYATVTGFLLLTAFHAHAILAGVCERITGGLMRVIATTVVWILPDFQRFDLSAAVFVGNASALGDGLVLAAYWAALITGYAALAAFPFRAREY
jgi:ABC-type transport system involved in multi-copper enzyme maturation permease subunit